MRVRAIRTDAIWAGLLVLVAVCVLSSPAGAQMQTREGIALQNQILELQREIQALAQRGGAGGYGGYPAGGYPPAASPSGANSEIVTRLLTRVEALESSVRELRGRLEELSNRVQQQNAQLSKQLADLQFLTQNPQAAGSTPAPGASGGPSTPPPTPVAPATPPAYTAAIPPPRPANGRRTPELIVQEGEAALERGDYGSAEQDAREVLANRASAHGYDAQFLLAQALLRQKQYSQAAIAYDDVYNRQKKGSHAQDSLLGLADALVAINEKRAACDTLSKLRAEFPTRSSDVQDRAGQIARRAGCR